MSDNPIREIRTPMRLDYRIQAGRQMSSFLLSLTEGKIVGRRSPNGRVYVPPRGACPLTGELMGEEVELPDVGTLLTYCIINIPFEGQRLTPPYAVATILLDGADLPLYHIIGNCPVSDVHTGMRVVAKWQDKLEPTLESIAYFEPNGEPDAPYDSYKEYI
jgi:uncharacterized OB-fold protein